VENNSIHVSQEGLERENNQDSAAFCFLEDRELWVIADGVTNAKDSGKFMSLFCKEIKNQWLANNAPVEIDQINDLIKSVHEKIRRLYICGKGSFLLLIIDISADLQHCFYIGDCRIGVITNNGISWKNFPHSLVYANGERDEKKLCEDPSRHTLYHVFKAKRFQVPEYHSLQLDLSKPFILATDGYWSNFPAQLPVALSFSSISDHLKKLEGKDDSTIVIRLAT